MLTILSFRIGHLDIADHLILGMAGAADDHRDGIAIHPVSVAAWDPLCLSLAKGDLDGAVITLPQALDLFGSGLDIALIMFAHRAGSRLTSRKGISRLSEFSGKSLLIPHTLSIQHMLMHKLMADRGMRLTPPPRASAPEICAEPVPMPLMAEFIKDDQDGDIAGFIASDPFVTQAVGRNLSKPLLTSQALWKDHPCCGLVVRKDRTRNSETIQSLVRQLFNAAKDLDDALTRDGTLPADMEETAAGFLKIAPEQVLPALKGSGIRYRPDLLVPEPASLKAVQAYMVEQMGVLSARIDLDTLINPSFARKALAELAP